MKSSTSYNNSHTYTEM